MTKKYKLITSGAISAATLGLLALAGSTFAHSGQTPANGADGRPQLTAEQKVANVAAMKVRLTDALTKAVIEGKITAGQEAYLLDAMEKIYTKIEAGDQDGAKLLKADLMTWLKTQNIDESVLPEMKSRLVDALTKAVTEGKITTGQQTHILDVMDQIHTKLEADDHAGADLLRAGLKTYLTQQNIDASVVPGLGKEGQDGKDKNQHVNNGHHYGNDKGDQHTTKK